MKIALCNVQEFNPIIGGIERVSVSLATQLIRDGIEVIFVSSRKSPYTPKYTLPAPQFTLPSSKDYSPDNVTTFSEIIQNNHVDILINQNAHSLSYHRLCSEVCSKTNTKLISVLHFAPDMRMKSYKNMVDWSFFSFAENIKYLCYSFLLSWPFTYITMRDIKVLYRKLYEQSDGVVLLSDKFNKKYRQIAKLKEVSKLVAIPNMLSFPFTDENITKENTIVWCARMSQQKNPYRALKIWSMIQNRIPDWKLQMIGDGPYLDRLKQFAKRQNLKNVEFTGFQTPCDYFKKAKIYMLTSNYEGWALTLTEAMQFGCVPIAFNSYESITDIIADDSCGAIIKPFDLPAFADKLLNLAKDENLALYGENARSYIKRYNGMEISKQWINLFNSLK